MFPLSAFQGSQLFDPMVLLLLALVVDALIGEVPRRLRLVPRPMAVVARITAALDRRLNRATRSVADRAIRGVLVVVVLAGLAAAVALGASWAATLHPHAWLVEFAAVFALVSQRAPFMRVRAIARALTAGSLGEARETLAGMVPYDTDGLDGPAIARGAVEAGMEHFAARIVGPVFWYALLGLPGMAVYMTVNRMAGVIGSGTARHFAFGLTAARLDDALGFFPARLAGLYLVVAALFVPTAKPLRALVEMLRDSGKHSSLNAGWPDGAAAGALGLALLGPGARGGWGEGEASRSGAWIGRGTADLAARDLHRALYLYGVACLLNASVVVALALLRLSD